MKQHCPYGPMDKAPAYGAGDSGFESQYGLFFCDLFSHARVSQEAGIRHVVADGALVECDVVEK